MKYVGGLLGLFLRLVYAFIDKGLSVFPKEFLRFQRPAFWPRFLIVMNHLLAKDATCTVPIGILLSVTVFFRS